MSNLVSIPVPRDAPPWATALVHNIMSAVQNALPAAVVDDGTINGTTIGLTTPAAAKFTSLTASTTSLGGLTTTTLAITQGAVISGTYTPTLTNTANLTSSTALQCQYMRVGSVVTVSGGVTLTPTILATLTTLGISLPIASTISAAQQLGGAADSAAVASASAAMFGDNVNNRATLQMVSVGTGSETFYFSFTYLVA